MDDGELVGDLKNRLIIILFKFKFIKNSWFGIYLFAKWTSIIIVLKKYVACWDFQSHLLYTEKIF